MTQLAIKPHHLGVSVPDMDAALEWYHTMLGFEQESRVYMDIIPADVAFIRNGNFRIELFQVKEGNPLPEGRKMPNLDVKTHGNKHICFSVRDVVGTLAKLKEKGADIVFQKNIQGTEMAFIRDVAGNLIELIECPELW